MPPHDDASANDPQAENGNVFALLSDAEKRRIWARICGSSGGPEHGKKISEEVSPELFNQHVTPDLLAVIRAWACFVRLDMAGYAEAMDACLAYAWRRGGWGFNADHLADLQDWIHDALNLAIDLAIDGQEA